MIKKIYLESDVLEAARERIAWTFDNCKNICISFSGGKDSTVMLHLVMDEAIKRKQKVGLLFIDWEAQFKLTIDHVKECFELYKEHVIPMWICLPFRTTNSVSQIEPEWTSWEPAKKDLWVREFPDMEYVIKDFDHFDFYSYNMTFEEFVPKFAEWFSKGETLGSFVGIRTQESLNRFRSIINTRKEKLGEKKWTTKVVAEVYNVYPIYDWRTEDIWTYLGKFGKPYNKLYDRMQLAGLSLHSMRICEPYGNEQKKGLWLFHVVEPETWGKISARVAGANSGSEHITDKNVRIIKPDGHTWQSYVMFLLETMPSKTSEHYKNKIAVYLKWWRDHGADIELFDCNVVNGIIPDFQKGDTGSKDIPSWRRITKAILKNDYWCSSLSFGIQKTAAYQKYTDLMKRRRENWDIFKP